MSKKESDFKNLKDTFQKGDYENCIKLGELFTKEFPSKGDGWNILGLAYKETGRIENAIKIFKFLVKQLPQLLYYKENLSNLYLKAGRLEEAKKTSIEIIDINPKSEVGLINLGLAFLEKNEIENAKSIFKKLIEFNPINSIANYHLGNIYKNQKEYKSALKYFKKSIHKHSKSNYLEILLCNNKPEELFKEYESLKEKEKATPLLGGVIEHASILSGRKNMQSYCNDIFKYISLQQLKNDIFSDYDCQRIIDLHKNEQIHYRKQKMLFNGKQSAGNIFTSEDHSILNLKKCIEDQLTSYKNKYKGHNQLFLKYWPVKTNLFGWIVTMKSGGFLEWHNHKEGWISGSFYLQVPERNSEKNSGSIAFTNEGPLYPKKENLFHTKTFQVKTRDICLFPSSIFHSTIPNNSNEERIVFVFDLFPE